MALLKTRLYCYYNRHFLFSILLFTVIICFDCLSVLNERGVFSGPANMSRLKAQLALETNEL